MIKNETTDSVVSREKNDCTVTAYATAMGVSYEVAYLRLAEAGRQPNRMFDFRKVGLPEVARQGEFGNWLASYDLEATLTRIPIGRFIICTAKHTFAVIDGKVLDYKAGGKRKVNQIYAV